MISLEQAEKGIPLRVMRIQESDLKVKLFEMGLYAGQEITVVGRAPFGDPIAVNLGNSVLAMRRSEAKLVQVEPLSVP